VSKSEVHDIWEKAAPGRAKWEHTFSASLSKSTGTLMAGIGLGRRVPDLACGAGSQTIQVAKRVGLLAVSRAVVADLTDAEIQSMGPKSTNALSSLRASIASGLRSNSLSGRGARQLSSDKLHSALFVATNDLVEANQSQCFHFS